MVTHDNSLIRNNNQLIILEDGIIKDKNNQFNILPKHLENLIRIFIVVKNILKI